MLRVILAALGFLSAPIVLLFGYVAVKMTFFPEPCRPYVDRAFAISTIETRLKKPGASGALKGAKPSISQIEEIENFAQDKLPGQKAYKFRLVGANTWNWPLAIVDPCGGLYLTGNLSGN
jgi:hypothetical protein